MAGILEIRLTVLLPPPTHTHTHTHILECKRGRMRVLIFMGKGAFLVSSFIGLMPLGLHPFGLLPIWSTTVPLP